MKKLNIPLEHFEKFNFFISLPQETKEQVYSLLSTASTSTAPDALIVLASKNIPTLSKEEISDIFQIHSYLINLNIELEQFVSLFSHSYKLSFFEQMQTSIAFNCLLASNTNAFVDVKARHLYKMENNFNISSPDVVNEEKHFTEFYINKSPKTAYAYNDKIIGYLPDKLLYLIENIKKSEAILLLEDDWDENGSDKYLESTWIAAIKFLLDYANTLFANFNKEIDAPKIYTGPHGSIDILWETASYTFLLNINKNAEDAVFYADNAAQTHRVRGEFKLQDYNKALIPFALQF